MAELLGAVQDTPIPNVLVLAGIAFIFLAIAGGLTDKVTVPKERQRLIGVIGALLLLGGIGLHLVDGPSPEQAGLLTPVAPAAAVAQATAAEPGDTAPAQDLPSATSAPPPTESIAQRSGPAPTPLVVEPTALPLAENEALPGVETIPHDQLAGSIPWLPLDPQAVPGSYYYLFNQNTPPFDDVRVRRAFVQAVDREALSALATSLGTPTRPASTFTPPETLGRDLAGRVGLTFDPATAAALLEEAGYPGGENFPAIKFVLAADASNEALATAAVSMWRSNLGVEPEIEILDLEDKAFFERLAEDPGNITVQGWIADYNDPDNFLYAAFDSQSDQRVGGFSSASFDRLVREAAGQTSDPAARQRLYVEAERILVDQAPILPIYHFTYTP